MTEPMVHLRFSRSRLGRRPLRRTRCPDARRLLARLGSVRIAAIVRILTGVLFVAEGLSKISGQFVRGDFASHVGGIAADSFPFWKRFLEWAVVPRANLFAWVI